MLVHNDSHRDVPVKPIISPEAAFEGNWFSPKKRWIDHVQYVADIYRQLQDNCEYFLPRSVIPFILFILSILFLVFLYFKNFIYNIFFFLANFIVQFLILSLILGIPLLTLHVCLGQRLAAGSVDMWKISPIFQGVGIALLAAQALIGIYSIVGVSWMFVYFRYIYQYLLWKNIYVKLYV